MKNAASHSPSVTLIFPAYNEARQIQSTISEASRFFYQNAIPFNIIVVADGTDGTREIVSQLAQTDSRISVMGSEQRRGKGRGIREAVTVAQGDFIGFADADNKTPITEFANFYPELKKGAHFVIGSRRHRHSQTERKQAFYRQIGSKGFNFLIKGVLGLTGIPDTQCGFKFFKRETAKRIFSIQKIDGYMFDVEILFLARKLGVPVTQLPVRWRDDGDSRLRLFSGNLKNLSDIFRIRLTRYEAQPRHSKDRKSFPEKAEQPNPG